MASGGSGKGGGKRGRAESSSSSSYGGEGSTPSVKEKHIPRRLKVDLDISMEEKKEEDVAGDGVEEASFDRVKTKAEIRAEKECKAADKIRQAMGSNKESRPNTTRPGEYYTTLVALKDDGSEIESGFPQSKFLAAYVELKERHPNSHARVTKKGHLEVWTNSVMENTKAASINMLAGIPVKTLAHKGQEIWGRVSGVFHQFGVAELMEVLESQGALEVKREVFTHVDPLTGQASKRNSNRIRIKFQGIPPKEINLGYQVFPVNICSPSPQMCYSCYMFGHKSAECTRQKVCRRCSKPGHIEKDCKAKPLCVNCKRDHSAKDMSCPVLQKRAESQRTRFVSTLVTSGCEVYEMPQLTSSGAPPESEVTGVTFAQVVKAGSKVILDSASTVKAVIPPVKPVKTIKKVKAPLKKPKTVKNQGAVEALLSVLRPLLIELVGKKTTNTIMNIIKAREPKK